MSDFSTEKNNLEIASLVENNNTSRVLLAGLLGLTGQIISVYSLSVTTLDNPQVFIAGTVASVVMITSGIVDYLISHHPQIKELQINALKENMWNHVSDPENVSFESAKVVTESVNPFLKPILNVVKVVSNRQKQAISN